MQKYELTVTHCEGMSHIGVKQGCPLSPHYLAYTLMNLELIWMRSTEILHVYLTHRSAFFFMLLMLFCSLNQEHTYKDY